MAKFFDLAERSLWKDTLISLVRLTRRENRLRMFKRGNLRGASGEEQVVWPEMHLGEGRFGGKER